MPKRRRTLEHRGLSDSDYMSIMEKVANENYTNWGFDNPDEALLYALNDKTYNYRGYYDKYPKGKGNAIYHWTDEFKTVYHPTFSNESKYSGKVDSNFNPNGFTGGMWLNDIYIPPKYQAKSRITFAKGGNKPITTGGAGYVPENNGVKAVKDAVYNYVTGGLPIQEVRQRLYNNIIPAGYGDAISRVRNAVVNNRKEDNGAFKNYITDKYRKNLWAEYLQIPKNKREYAFYDVENSPYRPTIADNKKIKYKRITPGNNLGIPSRMWLDVYRELADKKERQSKLSQSLGDFFGNHTISRGHEKGRGSYISYYDVWDLSPFKGHGSDESQGIGKPVYLYDRAYLDDLFNIEDEDKGAYWLPEITIRGNRNQKSSGGSIHIAPSKRGTFTAAASKHGMGVQEFANRVLANKENYSPAMVKKANFARNASKWKH